MSPLTQLITNSTHIAVISHVHPDGDAVGSVMGLSLGLRELGKEVSTVLIDPVPEVFSFLPHLDCITSTLPTADLYLVVDVSDMFRTGFPELLTLPNVVVIDHHPKGDLYRNAEATVQDVSASSAAEMVYSVLLDLNIKITPSIATSLLTGMYTDTGGFQYSNTSTKTLGIAAELMKRGARLTTIAHHISHTKSIAALKLLGIALERLVITQNGDCAVSVITQEDMQKCSALPEDMTGIINELNMVPQIKFSMLLVEITPGVIRGSLRTGEGQATKVSTIAKVCGGGGHPRASGFTIPGILKIDKATSQWRILPA